MEVENDTNDSVVYTVEMGGQPLDAPTSGRPNRADGSFNGRGGREHQLNRGLQYKVTFTITIDEVVEDVSERGIAFDRRVILRQEPSDDSYKIDIEPPSPDAKP